MEKYLSAPNHSFYTRIQEKYESIFWKHPSIYIPLSTEYLDSRIYNLVRTLNNNITIKMKFAPSRHISPLLGTIRPFSAH